ncbi:hypothetical protein HMPREF9103_01606 [Lentilactobacillus parafarraginis F0439]|uniref:N-acetyltransferase domain-containing protein n=1 Tax=Lentilactobacillus parafarraginis F0439 TaxID=797515 RepID=G9ZPF2_9LACO|nr:GNAT family N-acetyltransferase [Lentilactobacillus parafarraginis]EHL98366.1 hypothetical protein HMPREF9103_01606 [Lentilactobacillus parafarraginis F0439]
MITYSATKTISGTQLAGLLSASTSKPAPADSHRLQRILTNSNLLYTAWDADKLVGCVCGLNDKAYCCYLSLWVVRAAYNQRSIGDAFIQKIHHDLGTGISLVLLSDSQDALHYSELRFENVDSGFEDKRAF